VQLTGRGSSYSCVRQIQIVPIWSNIRPAAYINPLVERLHAYANTIEATDPSSGTGSRGAGYTKRQKSRIGDRFFNN
jgi:hypothetical protein